MPPSVKHVVKQLCEKKVNLTFIHAEHTTLTLSDSMHRRRIDAVSEVCDNLDANYEHLKESTHFECFYFLYFIIYCYYLYRL